MLRAADRVRFRTHFHHSDRAALVAVRSRDGLGVGVARYVRHPVDRESAELAIVVDDDWRDGDLATELLSRLAAHARAQGISRLLEVLPAADSHSMTRVVTVVCPDHEAIACEVDAARPSEDVRSYTPRDRGPT